MSDAIIQVENLGKCYRIQHQQERQRYVALRDVITSRVKGLFGNRQSAIGNRQSEEDFWAIKDISFEVKQGDVVGIIGRNGAGKSTLLKLLSRITAPTTGRIHLRGRVATLLEVGTGFHPELTGRENVFLNGAILGMTRAEIRAKFDEIVAFAEVDRFLDTPVKRYSSGMYVRLAFAVAAHLEPEILIVDEVLAVGDAEFQKKCLGKMQDMSRGGRTVLFVSHNLAAIEGLCSNGILLSCGEVAAAGRIDGVIAAYLSAGKSSSGSQQDQWTYVKRASSVTITGARLVTARGASEVITSGERAAIELTYKTLVPEVIGKRLSVSLNLFKGNEKVSNLWTNFTNSLIPLASEGVIRCELPEWPFRAAQFRVDVYTHIGTETEEWIEHCVAFESIDSDYYGHGVITDSNQGYLFINHEWSSHALQ